MSTDTQPTATVAAFRERIACILCGGTNLETMWKGSFGAAPVKEWLQGFRYDADVDAALTGRQFERVACKKCGMTFHRRILEDAWLKVLYERWISKSQIEAFERARSQGQGTTRTDDVFTAGVQFIKHLLRLRHFVPSTNGEALRVLDFGCGDGRFIALAASLGFASYGIDFSATRQARAHDTGVNIVGSLEEFDTLGVSRLHAATMFEVLEHVSDPLPLLRALAARLRPGGVLLLEVPDCRGITVPSTFDQFHAVQPLEHINNFTPESLAAMCERAGFVPLPRVPAHVTTSPVSVLLTEATRFVRRPTTSRYFRKA